MEEDAHTREEERRRRAEEMNAIMDPLERMMAEEREKRRKEEEENHAALMELRRPQIEEEQKQMKKQAVQLLMDHMQEIERRERCPRNWVAWDLKVETERKEIIERSEREESGKDWRMIRGMRRRQRRRR